MIRFRRLFDISTERDHLQTTQIREMFATAFPKERNAAERYLDYLQGKHSSFETVILIAEEERGNMVGFSVSVYFPEIRFAYLVYIASDPERPARGIGGALFEALREYFTRKGARGLFLDAGPDEVQKLKNPASLADNKRRFKFYERYGVRPVEGTLYDELANPANDNYQVSLLFDPLTRKGALRRSEARQFLLRHFAAQYSQNADDPYVNKIINSFNDDPVRIRAPKYAASDTDTAPIKGWLKPLKLVVSERHTIHHLREKGYVERPVRIASVLKGLEKIPYEQIPTRRYSEEIIKEVHDPDLVAYLKAISEKLTKERVLYPEVFPIRRPDRIPRELESRAGYFCMDTFTPLTSNVWRSAYSAANTALTAAEVLIEGSRYAYALVRPPGHHAERRAYGGFCYLNNAAIAAQRLSKLGKVAILDIDYHGGNGTQEIFYERADVYTLSIHGTPNLSYPHFSGFEDERGEGEGKGFNRNFPMRRGVDDERYLEMLEEALAVVRRFKPKWFVLSLGYDIMKGDPTGSFVVSAKGMREIGRRIGNLHMPTLVVQEGGYSLTNLRRGAAAFFAGLGETWY